MTKRALLHGVEDASNAAKNSFLRGLHDTLANVQIAAGSHALLDFSAAELQPGTVMLTLLAPPS